MRTRIQQGKKTTHIDDKLIIYIYVGINVIDSKGMNVIHYKNELFIRGMNIFSFQLLYKVSFSHSKWYIFSFSSFVSRRLNQVLCLSLISAVIGSNIFSVHRSSIKVLWCYLYDVLS